VNNLRKAVFPRTGTPMLLLTAATLLCACVDRDLVRPDSVDLRSSAAAAGPVFERGCARFEVRVSGKDRIEVRAVDGESCGPIQPVISGTPTFDVTKRTVRLPVALENRGQRKVKAPAWLLGWEDSLMVVSAPGLAQNKHTGKYLGLVAPDSVAEATDTLLRGARIWKYDQHLADAGQPQTLAAGHRSMVRWVEVSVHPGVETFRVALHARARRASNPVPPIPPDSVPGWIEDSVRYSEKHYAPGVVEIGFRWGTSLKEKQDAIDAISGEVIGGERYEPGADFEGIYYVQIDSDGSIEAIDQAVALLKEFPQVEYANAVVGTPGEELYLRPYDDPDWSQWQVQDTLADSENWGLEAISAPLAWGCEIGNTSAPVAVVDRDFDMIPQLSFGPSFGAGAFSVPADGTTDHGTAVAAVIGARGNDKLDITGGLWRSTLRVYDVAVDSLSGGKRINPKTKAIDPGFNIFDIAHRIRLAARQGAEVVNLSLSIPLQENDTANLRREYGRLKARWEAIPRDRRPLLVIGAGNQGIDATWSVLPLLAGDYPDHVLIVGAVERAGPKTLQLWNDSVRALRSNVGRLVTVHAPGGGITTLNGQGQKSRWSGTSFAAPHVTAIAGLLLSFDSTLTVPELRNLIVRGAERRNRQVAGKFLVNAYESLRLAAERKRAPLCGNRVWLDGSDIVIQRGGGTNAPTDRILAAVPRGGYFLEVLHGGRRIRAGDIQNYDEHLFVLRGGTWREEPDTAREFSRVLLSSVGRSHNGDTLAYFEVGGQLCLKDRSGRSWPIGAVGTQGTKSGADECIRRAYEPIWELRESGMVVAGYKAPVCTGSLWTGTSSVSTPGTPAYSPMGDQVLVPVMSSSTFTKVEGEWYVCPGHEDWVGKSWYSECRNARWGSSSGSGVIYSFPITGGGGTQIASGGRMERVAIAEHGREFMAESRSSTYEAEGRWVRDTTAVANLRFQEFEVADARGCTNEYRDMATGAVLLAVRSNCRNHDATLSPNRAPRIPPIISFPAGPAATPAAGAQDMGGGGRLRRTVHPRARDVTRAGSR
jgi:subtilisin family serine protease